MQIGGTDATTVFASSPHSASLPIVGFLEGYEVIVVYTTPSTPTDSDIDDDYDDDDYDDEDDEDLDV